MRNALLLSLALAAAAPAAADVKAGVDAWAKGDFRRAVEEWRGPAVAGDPDAQFNLGQAYKLGRGVPVDPGLAESWFRKAALQGHEQASDNYGLALFQSDRRTEALPWLEKGAARGEPRCQLVLGTMLFNGDGSARDYPRAYALMTRAAAAGLPSAAQTLAQMDQYITPADRERGTKLARQYAARQAVRPTPAGAPETRPAPPAARAQPAPARPVTLEAAPRTNAPRRMRAAPGGWGAQLGAFRDRANAEALWARVAARFPGATARYTEAGGLTRLQASGYPTAAAARSACATSGIPCVVVAP